MVFERPPIPERGSSKRLQTALNEVNDTLKTKRRQLNPKGSFNAKYWRAAVDVQETEIIRNGIRRQISIEEFQARGGNMENWLATKDAELLQNQLEVLKLKMKKSADQLQRVESGQDTESGILLPHRRSYLEMFFSSPRGLDVVSDGGKRDSQDQSSFRRGLIVAYNATNPEPGWQEYLWCPILSRWLPREYMTASHIFSYKHGQDTMDAIFGKADEPGLFSPENGLLISKHIEAKFESGMFVIVPDLPENPTAEAIAQWQSREPREYKLKIIERDPTKLNLIVPDFNRPWKDLDGKRLEFKNDFRPRSRYLYFHYCLQILRIALKEKHKGEIIRESELEKPFWGSPGKYMKRNMLLAFVEEVGHKYRNQLLQGAANTSDLGVEGNEEEEGGEETDDTGLLAAANEIEEALRRQEIGNDDDEDDGDYEDYEDYEDDEMFDD